MPKAKTRKRRCTICKCWFLPDVKHANRQKTCGPECRKELHRKRCAEYNAKNRKTAKADYLQKKLEAVESHCRGRPPEKVDARVAEPRIDLDLPRSVLQEVIGLRFLIVIEYVIDQLLRKRGPTRL